MPPDFGPKKLKFKRGGKGKGHGMFVCISLDGQMRDLHAN
jgi:hypothetical protein